MRHKSIIFNTITSLAVIISLPALAACNNNKQSNNSQNTVKETPQRKGGKGGGPQLGTPGGGPVIDKSGDVTLQAMIQTEVPKFKQLEYQDSETGKTLKYNLYTPENIDSVAAYPLVLFMADASTPGSDYTTPLTQGYGALVWATDEWQKSHPCYVLVPQFSGVAVNDEYQHTDEVDMVARLVKQIARNGNVDRNRLYTTGQSMGGMISMYYNVAYPDLFAASIFVDSHWNTSTFDELAKHKFVYRYRRIDRTI